MQTVHEVTKVMRQAARLWFRIQLRSLAAEARAVRAAEQQIGHRLARPELVDPWCRNMVPSSRLRHYRIGDLRARSRAMQLAYAYLRGRKYRTVEPVGSSEPPIVAVYDLLRRWGPVRQSELVQWFQV